MIETKLFFGSRRAAATDTAQRAWDNVRARPETKPVPLAGTVKQANIGGIQLMHRVSGERTTGGGKKCLDRRNLCLTKISLANSGNVV